MSATPIFVHEYSLPKSFAGRREQLLRLGSIAEGQIDPLTGKRPSVVAIRGIGGIGKSCLLRQLIDDVQHLPRYSRIVWYSLYRSRSDDVIETFRAIMRALAVSFDEPDGKGLAASRQLGRLLRDALLATSTIIVLDGLEVIQFDDPNNESEFGRINPAFEEVLRLLEFACAQDKSMIFISTRLRLTDLDGLTSYLDMPLDFFTLNEGVQLLKDLHVRGPRSALEQCVEACGGHALSLVAAGKYLNWKRLSAGALYNVTGDVEVFKHFPEGEKISRILEEYRADLTPQQEYFLIMLSVHPRAVTRAEFPVLAPDLYQNEIEVLKKVVSPLERLGLVEVHRTGDKIEINTHPLIKVATSTWTDASGKRQAHLDWAEAANRKPFSLILANAKALSDLQPALTTVQHYMAAAEYQKAWDLFERFLEDPLFDLGYGRVILQLLVAFSAAIQDKRFRPQDGGLALNRSLVVSYSQLGKTEESIRTLEQLRRDLPKYKKRCDWSEEEFIEIDSLFREFLARQYLHLGRVEEAKRQQFDGELVVGLFLLAAGKFRLASKKIQKVLLDRTLIRNPHETNNLSVWLAESLTRGGLAEQALTVLRGREEFARNEHLHCCLPNILQGLVHANLSLGNLNDARIIEDQRIKLMRETERPVEESLDLMLKEGRHEEVLRGTLDKLSTKIDDKWDKAAEIGALIVRAQAWHSLGERKRFADNLKAAKNLMRSFSFYRSIDDLRAAAHLFTRARPA